MIEVGTLAIIVVTVTASCGLGSFLAKLLWSAYTGRYPSYLFCARCHRMIGANDVQMSPHQLQEIIYHTMKRPPEIQMVPAGTKSGTSGSATFQRLGMRGSSPRGFDRRFEIKAQELESKALSPIQDSPQTGGFMANSGVEMLSPSPKQPAPQQKVSTSSQCCTNGSYNVETSKTNPDKESVFYNDRKSRSGKVHTNSFGGHSDLVYDEDKNHQVRVLESPPETCRSRLPVSKTPGNASGKRPIRPSASIRSRRSLLNRAFGSINGSNRDSLSIMVTQESDLYPSEAEARTPLLGEEQDRSNEVQSSRRNRGSPGNTTNIAGQLRNIGIESESESGITYSVTKEINIDRPNNSEKMIVNSKTDLVQRSNSGKSRTASLKKVRRTASTRLIASHYRPVYSESEFTSQSEDERYRVPLKVGKIFPSEEEDVIGDSPNHLQVPKASSKRKSVESHQSSAKPARNSTGLSAENLPLKTPKHVTVRNPEIRSPRVEDFPIVQNNQLITHRSREYVANEPSSFIQDGSLPIDLSKSCRIELETPALSPDKSDGSTTLPPSTDNSRVQSTSPHFNFSEHRGHTSADHTEGAGCMFSRRLDNQIGLNQTEFQFDGVHNPSLVSLGTHLSPQMVHPGAISSPQIMCSPNLIKDDRIRSPSWGGEVNIYHPNIHQSIIHQQQDKNQDQRSAVKQNHRSVSHSPLTPLVPGSNPPPPPRSSNFRSPQVGELQGLITDGGDGDNQANSKRQTVPDIFFPSFASPNYENHLQNMRMSPRHTIPKSRIDILHEEAGKGRVRSESQSSQDWIAHTTTDRYTAESSQVSGGESSHPYQGLSSRRATDSSQQSYQGRGARRGTESSQAQSLDWDTYQSDPHYIKNQLFEGGGMSSDDRLSGSDYSIVPINEELFDTRERSTSVIEVNPSDQNRHQNQQSSHDVENIRSAPIVQDQIQGNEGTSAGEDIRLMGSDID